MRRGLRGTETRPSGLVTSEEEILPNLLSWRRPKNAATREGNCL